MEHNKLGDLTIFCDIIFNTRNAINETQTEFRKRFGVTQRVASSWETNGSSVPIDVIAWCLNLAVKKNKKICLHCEGTGKCQDCNGTGYITTYTTYDYEQSRKPLE